MSADPVRFECRVLRGFSSIETVEFAGETEAIDWARSRVSGYVDAVTVEAYRPRAVGTFGIRHFKLEAGRLVDTGWSCWLDGDKVHTKDLDALFNPSPPLSMFGGV